MTDKGGNRPQRQAMHPEHHEKRRRFLELFDRIEAHFDGSAPLEEEDLDELLAQRQEAGRTTRP